MITRESDARAAAVIRANMESVGLPGGRLITGTVSRVLARRPGAEPPFDLAVADPPYAAWDDEVTGMLPALADGGWLAPAALVAVERASRSAPRAGLLATPRTGTAGTVKLPSGTVTPQASVRRRKDGMDVHRVACPGSFDPVTNGHLDIITRAALLHDEVIVVVGANLAKQGLFTVDERVDMLEEVTRDLPNVTIATFRGLLVDFCRAHGVSAIVKGLRAVSDFEYEMEMAQMNYRLAEIETLFMTANPLYSFLRSSLVKEIARYGGDVTSLVPVTVEKRLRAKLASMPPRDGGS